MISRLPELPVTDPTTAAVERAFCRHVAERLNGGILRYSQRLELLKAAERLRINRFRANLIIAMVQHQTRPTLAIVEDEPELSRPARRAFPIVAGMLAAEMLTVAGLWWICHL